MKYLQPLVIKVLKALSSILKDDRGNYSSMRVVLFIVLAFMLFIYLDWRNALYFELGQEEPDYAGLSSLFNAMLAGMISLGATLIAKIVQKHIENKTK